MYSHLLAWVTPIMIIALLAELGANAALGRGYFQKSVTFSNIACAILEQFTDVLMWMALIPMYNACYELRLMEQSPSSPWAWVVIYLLYDLCFYLWHRFSHHVPLAWLTHQVHHQSKDYNYTTAMRNAALDRLYVPLFWWPLPLLGFPLEMAMLALLTSIFYQFFLHTRFVGRLGPVEWLLCTPSSHRVHHGTNAKYLDRNFGGMFSIWDRLFGTYVVETEQPRFGSFERFETASPVTQNFLPWLTALRGRKMPLDPDMPPGQVSAGRFLYAFANLLVFLAITTGFQKRVADPTPLKMLFIWLFVAFNLHALTAVLENRGRALLWETARLASFGGIAWML